MSTVAPDDNVDATPPAEAAETTDGKPLTWRERRRIRKRAHKKFRRHRFTRRGVLTVLAILVLGLVAFRLYLPSLIRDYVNQTLDRNPLYDGRIGDISLHLWRGAYAIQDVQLSKTTGNVPVPLFSCKRMDLAIGWDALLKGTVVGRIHIDQPELNFVDDEEPSSEQTGTGGPWLEVISDLFPFTIDSCQISDGTIHFRAFQTEPPVDMYINDFDATVENLTNINNDVTPLVATVKARGMVLNHAPFECEMKLDPFSYRPTFELAVRLLGLDVTKTNPMTRAYGNFDFEGGWFDLVVEMEAKEGGLEGYVMPLFRNLKVLSMKKDVPEDNIVQVFWEALVGTVSGVLTNQNRDQFGTRIPFTGDLTNPQTDILATLGAVLRNAFVRAYLPRIQGTTTEEIDFLRFSPGSASDPVGVGNGH